MANITYTRLPQIEQKLNMVLAENGYSSLSGAPFLSQLINVIKEAVKGPYNEVYSIADHIDIGRASGSYLDRWGRFLSRERGMISYASDLSLTNTEIYINGDVTAADITDDGGDISIPAGTLLSSSDGNFTVRTIDNSYIRSDRNSCFVRVIAESSGNRTIPAYSLTNVSLYLNQISNVMPSAFMSYSLKCRNAKDITGGTGIADDATYRYLLQEAGNSLGISNDRKINLLYGIENISDIKIAKFRGGISVFIATTLLEDNDKVVIDAQQYINNILNFGMPVYCFAPVIRIIKPTIAVTLKNSDFLGTATETLKTAFAEAIIKTKMGTSIDLNMVIMECIKSIPGIISGSLYGATVNGRTLLTSGVNLEFNERLVCYEADITVKA